MMKIEKDQKYVRAKKKMEMLKAFYIHLTVYIFVNILLLAINLLTNPTFWWFLYPLVGWGVGLFIHGLTTFASGFGSDWETRKIKEYMEKDKREY